MLIECTLLLFLQHVPIRLGNIRSVPPMPSCIKVANPPSGTLHKVVCVLLSLFQSATPPGAIMRPPAARGVSFPVLSRLPGNTWRRRGLNPGTQQHIQEMGNMEYLNPVYNFIGMNAYGSIWTTLPVNVFGFCPLHGSGP